MTTFSGKGFGGYVAAPNSGTAGSALVTVITGRGKSKVGTTFEIAGTIWF
ncbi:hypothetical protein [Trichloromonas sp.]